MRLLCTGSLNREGKTVYSYVQRSTLPSPTSFHPSFPHHSNPPIIHHSFPPLPSLNPSPHPILPLLHRPPHSTPPSALPHSSPPLTSTHTTTWYPLLPWLYISLHFPPPFPSHHLFPHFIFSFSRMKPMKHFANTQWTCLSHQQFAICMRILQSKQAMKTAPSSLCGAAPMQHNRRRRSLWEKTPRPPSLKCRCNRITPRTTSIWGRRMKHHQGSDQ